AGDRATARGHAATAAARRTGDTGGARATAVARGTGRPRAPAGAPGAARAPEPPWGPAPPLVPAPPIAPAVPVEPDMLEAQPEETPTAPRPNASAPCRSESIGAPMRSPPSS